TPGAGRRTRSTCPRERLDRPRTSAGSPVPRGIRNSAARARGIVPPRCHPRSRGEALHLHLWLPEQLGTGTTPAELAGLNVDLLAVLVPLEDRALAVVDGRERRALGRVQVALQSPAEVGPDVDDRPPLRSQRANVFVVQSLRPFAPRQPVHDRLRA